MESSDEESGSDDEVIDLSASEEEEEESRDEVVELYETDEEENDDNHDPGVPNRPPPPIPDRNFPVDKPLPQLPPADDHDVELKPQESATSVSPILAENNEGDFSETGEGDQREMSGEGNEGGETKRGEKGQKLLPLFSFEEEEELRQDGSNRSPKVIESTCSYKNDTIDTEGHCQTEQLTDTKQNSDNCNDTSQSTKKNELVSDAMVDTKTDGKAR